MAKIVFIQMWAFEYLGVMYLSSTLKKHNHQTNLLIYSLEKDFFTNLKELKPDIVGFTSATGPHITDLKLARQIKSELEVPIILGGPHPTFFPEVIYHDGVDIICRGEGEYPLPELMDRIDKGEDYTDIPNLWVKQNGKIYKNSVRELINNLDALPFPDRELYSKYKILMDLDFRKFITARGCPYNCSFCFNHQLKKIYKGKGQYVRRRSISNVIEEIKEVKKIYKITNVRFTDDLFTLNRTWLFNFLELYKEEIDLPFTCQSHAREVDEYLARKLKESGCAGVSFGIESGNERIRFNILHKRIKNEEIIRTADIMRRFKIPFGTSNMLGLPTEIFEDGLMTLNLNARIKPDYTMCSLLQPYPKTWIYDYSVDQGLMDNFNADEMEDTSTSYLKLKDRKKLLNLHKLFILGVELPVLIPLIKFLVNLPPNKIFDLIRILSNGYRSMKNLNTTFRNTLRLGWHHIFGQVGLGGYCQTSAFKKPETKRMKKR